MRKIVIHCETGQVGTDSWDFVEVDGNSSIRELDDLVIEYALNNAEMYGIYPPCEGYDPDDESISDDISGIWYDYEPEKHDMYTTTGTPVWLN